MKLKLINILLLILGLTQAFPHSLGKPKGNANLESSRLARSLSARNTTLVGTDTNPSDSDTGDTDDDDDDTDPMTMVPSILTRKPTSLRETLPSPTQTPLSLKKKEPPGIIDTSTFPSMVTSVSASTK
ncbi:hypothetical protein POJ06DRAFT_234589 [Lipomyces tetrasporus]|uniref:Uncharacterized protein n=1 Tax=Lipomyces tetrasporus TaxID=54092 RepID=A0AAD7VVZ5_9ASCO|nr:uncharacterized protein POJ06DRAFT_234589 [Lipomyces tetrasporus]KAJ8103586.1 hypothetical protein POJ06DRAFT_234589 [Lipomyces tetrasporus]